jgi:dGTPase
MSEATLASMNDLHIVRETLRARESLLSPLAAHESSSPGRDRPEAEQRLRLKYQLDRDRIIHTRAFRRLKHKTQVFVTPDSDHVVTRMTHTIEVQQIARTIARALALNEDLTEAIALGHDLGHTPFGHAGEEELARLLPDGFRHNEQSLRIVEHLENGGAGLNLMFETRDGILRHSKGRASVTSEEGWGSPATLEGEIVKLSDSIAYLNHDIQDAIRAGLITEHDLPAAARATLGEDHATRIDTLVTDCVRSSLATFEGQLPSIVLPSTTLESTDQLRDFMFQRVYLHELTIEAAERGQRVVRALFEHYRDQPDQIAGWSLLGDPPWRRAADYVSGMTDHYALRRAAELHLLN